MFGLGSRWQFVGEVITDSPHTQMCENGQAIYEANWLAYASMHEAKIAQVFYHPRKGVKVKVGVVDDFRKRVDDNPASDAKIVDVDYGYSNYERLRERGLVLEESSGLYFDYCSISR